MNISTTPMADLLIVDTHFLGDERGQFARYFCQEALEPILNGKRIVQINHSLTKKVGAIRGLHYQKSPMQEMKLVRCTQGKVFDVAVDLRLNSPTFLHWFGIELSANNGKMMVIPEGFAHGFQALEENSEMLYLHTEFYSPKEESGVYYNDRRINIQWPQECSEISAKDANLPALTKHFLGVI